MDAQLLTQHHQRREAPHSHSHCHSTTRDDDVVLVHDAWAAPPIAPGVYDLDTSMDYEMKEVEDPFKFHYTIPMETPAFSTGAGLPLGGLGFFAPQHNPQAIAPPTQPFSHPFTLSPESQQHEPLLPPAPRPTGLNLAPCCSPEEERRGRSPPLHVRAACPPAPRLGCSELGDLPAAVVVPPTEGTRPPVQRGFSALGLDFAPGPSKSSITVTPPSPPASNSSFAARRRPRAPTLDAEGEQRAPTRRALERRGNSDQADVTSRVANWCGAVAAATFSGATRDTDGEFWADELSTRLGRLGDDGDKHKGIRPRPQHTTSSTVQRPSLSRQHSDGSRKSGYSTPGGADQLDSWASKVGRARGRQVDMPVQRRTRAV
ncbi:uncharacterized protein EHS24_008100 [Apiotrichum porosum]|uniref:Uncharacterized protein n=1 Tax=Apiotrichum porosum TaxID=105984 RepID=A0A427XSW6_9TREE|nr:uncharacterized protein EHS24_008100 [Apiotrichum porosum]RSH81903.1 hypothetical protein EHS24_008100 [Apiotrichum porosum]